MARKAHSIKFSDEEWEQVKERAEAEKMAASTYVREAATEGLDPESKGRRRSILAELFVLGGKVKEMRRDFQGADYEHDSVAVGQLLDRIRETIDRIGGYAVVGAPEEKTVEEPEAPLSEQEPTGT